MRVIPPVQITTITSSTVPEEVAATYNAGTTYAEGALVGLAPVYGSAQTVWRSKQNGNTGQALADGDWWQNAGIVYPVYNSGSSCDTGGIVTDLANHDLYESLVDSNTGNALSDTESWKYIGKTNRYRAVDYTRNNRTTVPLSMTFSITPGQRVDSIGLVGIKANSYTVTMTSTTGGGTVFTETGSLNTRFVATWYEHLTVPFTTQPSLTFFDLPPFFDCVITVTLEATSGDVALAALVVGLKVDLGVTQHNAVSDVLNFSTVTRDQDGNAILEKRRNIPKSNQTVICDKMRVDIARRARADLNAAPALWYGLDDPTDGYFETVAILGFYREFRISTDYPQHAVLQIELEEV